MGTDRHQLLNYTISIGKFKLNVLNLLNFLIYKGNMLQGEKNMSIFGDESNQHVNQN